MEVRTPNQGLPGKDAGLIFCLVAILLTAVGCGPANPRGEVATDPGALDLVLEQTFGASDDSTTVLTGETKSLIVDGDDNVYILTDARGRTDLHSFAPDGSLNWVLDVMGRAPGELRYAWGMAWDGDSTLYLANQLATRIDRFTLKGGYVDSKLVAEIGPTRLVVFGYLQTGLLAAYEPIPGEFGGKISVVDLKKDWAIVDTFSIRQSGTRDVSDQISLSPQFFTFDNAIITGNMVEYRYTWYSRHGEANREVVRSDVTIEPPRIWGSELGVSMMTPSELWPIVPIGEGLLLGGGKWPRKPVSQEKRLGGLRRNGPGAEVLRILDLFDAITGELLRSLDAESYGIKRLVGSDARGRFYAELTGDELVVGRFRIEGLD